MPQRKIRRKLMQKIKKIKIALVAFLLLSLFLGPRLSHAGEANQFDGTRTQFSYYTDWQADEMADGSAVLYQSEPGRDPLSDASSFLVWYYQPDADQTPEDRLGAGVSDLGATPDGDPLEATIGNEAFVGQFANGNTMRYFLAYSDDWGLLVQAPRDEWETKATELNLVLRSVIFP
jgi:hypothetical protein